MKKIFVACVVFATVVTVWKTCDLKIPQPSKTILSEFQPPNGIAILKTI